jgi:nucleotide-binding universal stress UspA family protein
MLMVVIKNILCPVDLSEFSAQALRYAAALASLLDAGLSVLLVRAGKSRDRDLEAFTSDALGPGSRQQLIEKDGYPSTEILRTAAAIQTDLIVMATHGRTGLQRLLLGSVTEKVVRSSQYPVLTLRPVTGHQVPASRKPETIVCAVDFSLPSKRALEYAAFVASKSRGRLLVIHALEWSEESDGASRNGVSPLPTSEQDAVAQLNDLVTDEIRRYPRS